MENFEYSSPTCSVGGGTRYKYGVAKVYAVGLYVDEAAVAGALKAYADVDGKALAKDASFYAAVAKVPVTLLLNFHRSVDGATIAGALKDSLAKKLDAATLASFEASLTGVLKDGVKPDTKLYFACGGGDLGIGLGAPDVRATAPGAACGALMDVYYGASPVSAQAKEGMALGFAKL